MDQKAVIEKLIEELKLTLTRPTLFIGETTVSATQTYLSGMYSALIAMGIMYTRETRRAAVESRGWESTATGGVAEMREQGVSEEQMVQELLLIEIKMLEIVRDGLEA